MLEGLNILLVGASGDIGRAMVRVLAAAEAHVVATYNSNGDELFRLLEEFPATTQARQLDVRKPESCESLGDYLVDNNRIPDVLIYNAGVTMDCPVLGMSDDYWNRVMDVNLKGALNVVRSVVKHMSRKRGGKIFLVSSAAADKGGRGQANYAASKAGLQALGRSLAVELARKDILVNSIAPGIIKSRMSEQVLARAGGRALDLVTLGRPGLPEEVAAFVAHLSSPDITYITGQTFAIDGGFKL